MLLSVTKNSNSSIESNEEHNFDGASVTLDDVVDCLLAIPSASQRPSPSGYYRRINGVPSPSTLSSNLNSQAIERESSESHLLTRVFAGTRPSVKIAANYYLQTSPFLNRNYAEPECSLAQSISTSIKPDDACIDTSLKLWKSSCQELVDHTTDIENLYNKGLSSADLVDQYQSIEDPNKESTNLSKNDDSKNVDLLTLPDELSNTNSNGDLKAWNDVFGPTRMPVKNDTRKLRSSLDCQPNVSSASTKEASIIFPPSNNGLITGKIKCSRMKCNNALLSEEALVKFRMCSNCEILYCGRQCRRIDWEIHKSVCPYNRVVNLCQQVLFNVRRDNIARRHVSVCARKGFHALGRGAVKLIFSNPDDALEFIYKGWDKFKGQIFYIPLKELVNQEMDTETCRRMRYLCHRYQPETKLILLCTISVNKYSGTAGNKNQVLIRGLKMRLTPPFPEDDIHTVLLSVSKEPDSDLEERDRGFYAIQRHLMDRGICLEIQFPDVFAKIKNFVQGGNPFVPFSIFLNDSKEEKMIFCILLPCVDGGIIHNVSSKIRAHRPRSRCFM